MKDWFIHLDIVREFALTNKNTNVFRMMMSNNENFVGNQKEK